MNVNKMRMELARARSEIEQARAHVLACSALIELLWQRLDEHSETPRSLTAVTPSPTAQNYVDDRELAERTPISRKQWQHFRATGSGPPYIKVGRRCLYAWADVISWISERKFSPAERAREKAASREADRIALESGEKTAEDLRRENASFAFPDATVRFPKDA